MKTSNNFLKTIYFTAILLVFAFLLFQTTIGLKLLFLNHPLKASLIATNTSSSVLSSTTSNLNCTLAQICHNANTKLTQQKPQNTTISSNKILFTSNLTANIQNYPNLSTNIQIPTTLSTLTQNYTKSNLNTQIKPPKNLKIQNLTHLSPINTNSSTNTQKSTIKPSKTQQNFSSVLANEQPASYRQILTDTPLLKTADPKQDASNVWFLLPETYYFLVEHETTLSDGTPAYYGKFNNFSGYAIKSAFSTLPSSTNTDLSYITISLNQDAGTRLRSTPQITDNTIRILPQGTNQIKLISYTVGDKPSDGVNSSLWYFVVLDLGDTTTCTGYIYSERCTLSSPITKLNIVSKTPEAQTPTQETGTNNSTPSELTLNLSKSPILKWIIVILFIVPVVIIFLMLIKKPKIQNYLEDQTTQTATIVPTPAYPTDEDTIPQFADIIPPPAHKTKRKCSRFKTATKELSPFVKFSYLSEHAKELSPENTTPIKNLQNLQDQTLSLNIPQEFTSKNNPQNQNYNQNAPQSSTNNHQPTNSNQNPQKNTSFNSKILQQPINSKKTLQTTNSNQNPQKNTSFYFNTQKQPVNTNSTKQNTEFNINNQYPSQTTNKLQQTTNFHPETQQYTELYSNNQNNTPTTPSLMTDQNGFQLFNYKYDNQPQNTQNSSLNKNHPAPENSPTNSTLSSINSVQNPTDNQNGFQLFNYKYDNQPQNNRKHPSITANLSEFSSNLDDFTQNNDNIYTNIHLNDTKLAQNWHKSDTNSENFNDFSENLAQNHQILANFTKKSPNFNENNEFLAQPTSMPNNNQFSQNSPKKPSFFKKRTNKNSKNQQISNPLNQQTQTTSKNQSLLNSPKKPSLFKKHTSKKLNSKICKNQERNLKPHYICSDDYFQFSDELTPISTPLSYHLGLSTARQGKPINQKPKSTR